MSRPLDLFEIRSQQLIVMQKLEYFLEWAAGLLG